MPLTVNWLPKQENKEIVMGKKEQVADYYPPGATEPIVRPADVPAPNENPEGVIVNETKSGSSAVDAAKESFHEDVAKSPKKSASKAVSKKK